MNAPETSFSEQPCDRRAFIRDGITSPIRVFTPAQCALIVQDIRLGIHPAPLDWAKGRAASDRFFYDLATRPTLLALMTSLLGEDVVLWGVDVIERDPGQIHPWHTDVETSEQGKHFVSAWVGLLNTSQESALQFITRSHTFGKPVQEALNENGLRRGEASDATVLAWARDCDPLAELVQPQMTDGEAILYDGGLWHASHNSRREGRRLALLLQYAAADTAVSIPDFSNPGWPFRFTEMRPPTIVVSGRGNHAVNRLVPPPTACPESHSVITTQVQKITVPLPEDENGWWRMCQLFCGSTPLLNFIECHLSVLSPGQSSHPSHVHAAESVHLVLDGELELQFGEGPASENEFCKLVSNSFVFYRAFVPHTNRNPGTTPTTYLALSWRAAPAEMNHFADASIVYFGKDWSSTNSDSHARQLPFDYPTSYLSNLHVNLITLPPGGGHDPQVNEYDVAILLLSGTVETLGQIVKAHSFVFCAAGESSGMRNVGNEPARYVVFEFHAPRRLYRNRVSFPLIQVPAADPPSKRPAQEFRSFWAGPPLSAYEKLSLRSLVARGQRVFLYSYDKSLQVPDGVDLCDANEILAGDHIHEFVHDNGETSPTLHANLFRYEVLRRFGGWYCDLDVVLVGNHPPSIDVYFAREDEAFINNAVLRFPPGAPLMVAAVEAARGLMTSTEWGASGPRLLTRLINDQGLSRLAQSWHAAYPVSPAEVRKLFLPEHREELEDRVAGADFVHLWNQIWRRVRLPKDYGPPEGSFLDSLFRSFEIRVAPGARMSEKAVRSWFGEFDIFDAAKRQRRNISGIGDLTDLTQALQQARWERDELLKSTSWRVTAPLRTVGRALQRLKDRLVDFGTHTAD